MIHHKTLQIYLCTTRNPTFHHQATIILPKQLKPYNFVKLHDKHKHKNPFPNCHPTPTQPCVSSMVLKMKKLKYYSICVVYVVHYT